MARPKKSEKNKPVVAQLQFGDTPASNSESTPSRRKGAKNASITKEKHPQRNDIAKLILNKYVKPEKIVWGRDMAIAYKLADRHPLLEFWRQLPVKHQLETLVIMWSESARLKLTREFANYQQKLQIQRRIKVDESVHSYTIGQDKIGADYVAGKPKPRSLVEFCR